MEMSQSTREKLIIISFLISGVWPALLLKLIPVYLMKLISLK